MFSSCNQHMMEKRRQEILADTWAYEIDHLPVSTSAIGMPKTAIRCGRVIDSLADASPTNFLTCHCKLLCLQVMSSSYYECIQILQSREFVLLFKTRFIVFILLKSLWLNFVPNYRFQFISVKYSQNDAQAIHCKNLEQKTRFQLRKYIQFKLRYYTKHYCYITFIWFILRGKPGLSQIYVMILHRTVDR